MMAARGMTVKEPEPGELWRHQNGTIYRVVCLAVNEATHDVMVVYEESVNAPSAGVAAWVRTLDSWMTPKNNLPRFTLVATAC